MENISAVTTESPACFGVMCQKHEVCKRYHMIEEPGIFKIYTCHNGTQETPLFLPIEHDNL